MVQSLFDNYIFIYAMAGLCGLGIIIKVMVSTTYKRLIKASDNMGTTKNKLMKLMKMKFEACYKLKIGVNNVDSFVDKYVYKHKICGIHLYTWENISGQLLILCLLTGTIGLVLGLAYDCGKNNILFTFFSGVFSSSLLIAVESFINISAKRNIIKVNITDYLDNFLKIRLEHESLTPQILKEYGKEYFTPIEETKKRNDRNNPDSKDNIKEMVERLRKEEEELRVERERVKDLKVASVLVSRKSEDEKDEPSLGKTRRDRDKEMLLREKEQKRILNQRQRQEEIESQKVLEKIQQVKPNVEKQEEARQGDTQEKGYQQEENMDKYLLYNLMETAACKEETISKNATVQQEKKDKESRERVESEEKIIEDILKEFLA